MIYLSYIGYLSDTQLRRIQICYTSLSIVSDDNVQLQIVKYNKRQRTKEWLTVHVKPMNKNVVISEITKLQNLINYRKNLQAI